MASRRLGGSRHRAPAARMIAAQALLGLSLVGAGATTGRAEPADAPRFQVTIDELARALDANAADPSGLSEAQQKALAEFVAGNMLFALCHEMAHAVITEMGLPVLGREEDAADAFATLGMLQLGTAFSDRVLVEAAKGWFLDDWRDQKEGVKLAFYDEHGLDQQRAYQIVCLMVGSDPDKFKSLADETALPQDRQGSCQGDYSNASWSWQRELEPHRRAAAQPQTKIDVVYGEGAGKLDAYARAFRSIGLLEAVAEHVGDQFVWRSPIALEMRSCGDPGTHWDVSTRTLTLCYEMAEDFAQLYRDYAQNRTSLLGRLPLGAATFAKLAGALAAGLLLGYGAGAWRRRRSDRWVG